MPKLKSIGWPSGAGVHTTVASLTGGPSARINFGLQI